MRGLSGDQGDALRAVLWDMDGTLVDSEKLWDVSLGDLARHLGGELGAEGREAMVGSSLDRTVALMFDQLGLQRRVESMAEAGRWLTARTEQLFTEGLPWQPGALEALTLARAAGLRTALVTSTHRGLVEVALNSIGRTHFDVTVCGDEVTATKPAPDPYLIAARLLDVQPGDCLAVEDSPTGATAAEAAGCAVLVIPSEVPVPPGPARIQRADLRGLTETELRDIWRRADRSAVGRPEAPTHH